jgi:hypothetical protein
MSSTNCNHTVNLNDLWKFDGYNWTWMSGSNEATQIGNYGILGIPDESNVPSPRQYALSWTDLNGNLWLFGGGEYYAGKTKDYSDMKFV